MSEQLDQSTIREFKALEAKVHQLSLQVQAALSEQTLDELDDVEVKYLHGDDAPQSGFVLTWDATTSTPYGGLARFAPSVAGDVAVSQALGSDEDSGSFDEVTPFNFQPVFVVNANSYQLVLVTVFVDSITDSLFPVGGTGLPGDAVAQVPTPWKVTAYDATGDPLSTRPYGCAGVGICRVTFPLWLHNDTDTDTGHTTYIDVEGVTAYEFDGTVTVRAESVFQMAAIP